MSTIEKLELRITANKLVLNLAKTDKKKAQLEKRLEKSERRLVVLKYKADKREYLKLLTSVKYLFTQADKVKVEKKIAQKKKVSLNQLVLCVAENIPQPAELPQEIIYMIVNCPDEDLPNLRRKLAFQYHPDRCSQGLEIMQQINQYFDELFKEIAAYYQADDYYYDQFGVPIEIFTDDESNIDEEELNPESISDIILQELPQEIIYMIVNCPDEDLPNLRRKLAFQYHPDRCSQGLEIMQQINQYFDELFKEIAADDQPDVYDYDQFGVPIEIFTDDESEYSERCDYSTDDEDYTEKQITQSIFEQRMNEYYQVEKRLAEYRRRRIQVEQQEPVVVPEIIPVQSEQRIIKSPQMENYENIANLFSAKEKDYCVELGGFVNLEEIFEVIYDKLDDNIRQIICTQLESPLSIQIMSVYYNDHLKKQQKKLEQEILNNTKVKCFCCNEETTKIFTAQYCDNELHQYCQDYSYMDKQGNNLSSTACCRKQGWLTGCYQCDKSVVATTFKQSTVEKTGKNGKVKIQQKEVESIYVSFNLSHLSKCTAEEEEDKLQEYISTDASVETNIKSTWSYDKESLEAMHEEFLEWQLQQQAIEAFENDGFENTLISVGE